MASYENLPVFKATYDLLLRVYGLGQHWTRDLKYTIGEGLKKEIYDVLVFIYSANSKKDKTAHIEMAREGMVRIKIQLRVLKDLKQLTVKQYAGLCEMSESVSKQLAAWSKYQQKENVES